MDIYKLMLLAEEGPNPMDGMFSGIHKPAGIILIITGVLIIYIAVKVAMGYRFLPAAGGETIIEEDTYVETEAKALQKKKSTLPDYGGGGEKELIEWKIGYTVNDEKFTQIIPDDGYEKGDIIKIKYDPKKPDEFYLVTDEEPSSESEENNSSDTAKSRNIGLIFGALGVLVIIGGIALVLM